MADNTTLNSGTGGDVIATDDISGVKYQRVKIVLGADGSNDGDVHSGNKLPVVEENSVAIQTATEAVANATTTPNSAIPSNGVMVMGSEGANARVIRTDSSGNVYVLVGSLPSLPAGSNSIGTLGANSGVDIGDVTINNGSGASAVNIQDGGNSITVDNGGTFAVQASLNSGTNYVGKVRLTDGTNDLSIDTAHGDGEPTSDNHLDVANRNYVYNGSTFDMQRGTAAPNASTTASETGIAAAGVGPGFSRIDSSQTVTANGQSRTINAKGSEQLCIQISGTWVGTLTFEYTIDGSTWVADSTGINGDTLLRTSGTTTANGTWFFDSSSVSQYRVRSTAWTSGTANIVFIASIGSAITYGAIINPRPDLIGVAHTWKSANYTTTQTGAAIWTPASGKKINITSLSVSSYGTTAARVIIWFGASADTTYTAGTDQLVWAGSFAPSATAKPGMINNFTLPMQANTADYVLRITTDAGISLDITVYGYES